jgi:hypothetical protein
MLSVRSSRVRLTRSLWSALLICLVTIESKSNAQAQGSSNPNTVILSILPTMPTGGGYSASSSATRDLQSAAQVRAGRLELQPTLAHTTYCSGATYLVFLRALEVYLPGSTINGSLADSLAIKGQPDGVGVWGRWNANGPGTACLFHELGIGRNFSSFEEAKPGDFMKIFWSDAVGRREHGHSVIYLGKGLKDGIEMVRFWSSNIPNGYGEKSVPRTRIAKAIFSRLEYPAKIEQALTLPPRNRFLSSLLSADSSFSEALAQSGAN